MKNLSKAEVQEAAKGTVAAINEGSKMPKANNSKSMQQKISAARDKTTNLTQRV